MAELTKDQVDQSLARVERFALGDDDVALQTSATLPASVKVKGQVLDTAGNDQHDPTVSYTTKQVRQIAEQWGSRGSGRGGRRSGAGRPRRSSTATRQGRTQAAETTTVPESDKSADKPAADQAADGS
jgi:hypothetical protein